MEIINAKNEVNSVPNRKGYVPYILATGSHVLPNKKRTPNAFIEGIDCTINVNKKAITNTRILKAINTSEALKKFSICIWRKDRFIFMFVQTFEVVKDEISLSNDLLRESPDFVCDNFITINRNYITI